MSYKDRAEWPALVCLLKRMRESAGLSQSEMGRRLGKGQAYVWKVENGERGLDVFELMDYGQTCGVDMAAMFVAITAL